MQSELKVSKSILAKLLASENISVVHRQTPTAAFDLKGRTLILPMWNDMDGDLYDLLVGHEIGHALYTPEQGWHNSVEENKKNKAFKGFLNVIEDARIEKMVKRKYAGMARCFAAGYKELYERDLFGVKKLPDVNKLNLIDRINLHFKLGAHVLIKFTDQESDFIRETAALETWDQVVDLATRIYAYVKEQESDKLNSTTDLDNLLRSITDQMQEEMNDDEEDQDDSDDMYDDEEEMDDFETNGNSSSGDYGDESDEKKKSAQSRNNTSDSEQEQEEDDGEPRSITDASFRDKEQKLVNGSGNVGVFTLPEVNLDNILLNNKIVIKHIEEFIEAQISSPLYSNAYSRMGMSYDTLATKCVNKFNKNNKKYVMHLLKEFEMRKKAYQYARTTQARTGELNTDLLHKYKHSTDLFKKMNIIGKAKSHGMVLFLDMSGSMSEIFRNTLEQLLVLSSFCKLANIPFDVYGFSNDEYIPLKSHHSHVGHRDAIRPLEVEIERVFCRGDYSKYSDNYSIDKDKFIIQENGMTAETRCGSFHLKHLLGSSLSPVQYRRAFNALAIVTNEYNRGRWQRYGGDHDNDHGNFQDDWSYAGLGLNGTPTTYMLLCSRDIIRNFKEKHKVDIVNTIHLTDGEGDGNTLKYPHDTPFHRYTNGYRNTSDSGIAYLVDKKSKKRVKIDYSTIGRYSGVDPIQQAVTKLVADITGTKQIGFRLVEQRMSKYVFRELLDNVGGAELESLRKNYRENNFMATTTHGYDKFFYIGASNNNIKDEELKIEEGMTKAKIASAFKKSQTGKKSNRVLVSKFSEEIAA